MGKGGMSSGMAPRWRKAMHSKTASRFMIRLTVQLLAVLASMTVATAHAKSSKHKSKKAATEVTASTATPVASDPGVSLKFDGGLVDSVPAEDCEDGGDLMTRSSPAYSANPASSSLPALAKNMQTDLSPAQTAAAPKSGATTSSLSLPPLQNRVASVASQTISQPMIPRADQSWDIVPTDKTLNAALARWASIAGWQLMWELPVDYAVEARTTVPGSFEEAVSTVAKSMETAEIPMKAIFYHGTRCCASLLRGLNNVNETFCGSLYGCPTVRLQRPGGEDRQECGTGRRESLIPGGGSGACSR